MNFLSIDNYNLLYGIVKEHITDDPVLFDTLFNDFGHREKGTLMTLNKKFLKVMNDLVPKTPTAKKVTFDAQCNSHEQNFLSYIPKPPPTPIFADMPTKDVLKNIDEIMKETLAYRQYETIPTKPSTSLPTNTNTITNNTTHPPKTPIKTINIHSTDVDDANKYIQTTVISLDSLPSTSTSTFLDIDPVFEESRININTRLDAICLDIAEIKEMLRNLTSHG